MSGTMSNPPAAARYVEQTVVKAFDEGNDEGYGNQSSVPETLAMSLTCGRIE